MLRSTRNAVNIAVDFGEDGEGSAKPPFVIIFWPFRTQCFRSAVSIAVVFAARRQNRIAVR